MVEYDPGAAAGLAPELQELLVHWQGLLHAAGGPPHPDAVMVHITGKWLSLAALIAPGRRAGFTILTCGYDLIRRFGRLATGERVSALAPGIREDLSHKLVRAVKARDMLVASPRVALGRVPVPYGEIILPMARDGGRINSLLLFAREQWPARPRLVRELLDDWCDAEAW